MVGIGLGLGAKTQQNKKPVKKSVSSANQDDQYSNDDFESMSMSKSITVSASNKIVPTKKKIGTNLVVPDKKQGKFSNYSPIKEADEENRYAGEESKESKPSPGDDYESEEDSPSASISASKSLSAKKARYSGKSAIESSGASSSLSQSKDPEKAMASQLKKFMKNDYAVSMSASGKRRGKGDSDDDYDESSAFYSESATVTGSVGIDKKFEYLR